MNSSLIISGVFDREALQRSCAALYRVKEQGYGSVNIDMRTVTRGFAADLLPFATRCRELLVIGVDTLLELPEDAALSRLFKNSNWAYLIDPRQYDQSQYFSDKHIPAVSYADADSHFQAVDQVVDKLLSSLEGFSRDQLAALEWAVNEITDNVLNHASSAIGGSLLSTLTVLPAAGRLFRSLRQAQAESTRVNCLGYTEITQEPSSSSCC